MIATLTAKMNIKIKINNKAIKRQTIHGCLRKMSNNINQEIPKEKRIKVCIGTRYQGLNKKRKLTKKKKKDEKKDGVEEMEEVENLTAFLHNWKRMRKYKSLRQRRKIKI